MTTRITAAERNGHDEWTIMVSTSLRDPLFGAFGEPHLSVTAGTRQIQSVQP
jgi:hypothetical protein